MKAFLLFLFTVMLSTFACGQNGMSARDISVIELSKGKYYISWDAEKGSAFTVKEKTSGDTYSTLMKASYSESGFYYVSLTELSEGTHQYRIALDRGSDSVDLVISVDEKGDFLSFIKTSPYFFEFKSANERKKVVVVLFDEDGEIISVPYQGSFNAGLNLVSIQEQFEKGKYLIKVVTPTNEIMSAHIFQ